MGSVSIENVTFSTPSMATVNVANVTMDIKILASHLTFVGKGDAKEGLIKGGAGRPSPYASDEIKEAATVPVAAALVKRHIGGTQKDG